MLSVDVIYGRNIRYSFHHCEFLNKRKNKDVLIFRSFVFGGTKTTRNYLSCNDIRVKRDYGDY